MKVIIFFMSLVLVLVAARPLRCYRETYYGTCKGYIQMWTYSRYDDTCTTFNYSGCGGNDNRFFTRSQCRRACINPRAVKPPFD